MRNKNTTNKGFTLIELLVVISTIGMLASIVMTSVNVARVKARDARRLGDMHQLATALELYFADNSSYPVVPGIHVAKIAIGTPNIDVPMSDVYWSSNLGVSLSPYVSKMPMPPVGTAGGEYDYMNTFPSSGCIATGTGKFIKITDNQGYILMSLIENSQANFPANTYYILGGKYSILDTCS